MRKAEEEKLNDVSVVLSELQGIAHLLEMISFYEISDRPELVTSLEFLARGIRHIEETAQEGIESLWHLEDKIA